MAKMLRVGNGRYGWRDGDRNCIRNMQDFGWKDGDTVK